MHVANRTNDLWDVFMIPPRAASTAHATLLVKTTSRQTPSMTIDAIFAVSPAIRYVAIGRGQDVQLRERPDLADAS